MICTFFGHADAPKSIEPIIKSTLIDLIENQNATTFYVGNNGSFDRMIIHQLEILSKEYLIKYSVVLAYLPNKNQSAGGFNNTVFPEGLECVPPRFAIYHRNKWMIEQSDVVITYVNHPSAGASKFKALAEKKKKTVINISA